jgi:hypothetical protein
VSGGLEPTVSARLAMKRPAVTTDALVKKGGKLPISRSPCDGRENSCACATTRERLLQ